MTDNIKEIERLQFLKDCLHTFQQQMLEEDVNISFYESLDDVCNEINTYYWRFIALIKTDKYLMGKEGDDTPTNANIYKIISATEFSIMRIQPIVEGRELNAKLTFFVSFCFYRWWFRDEILNDNFLGDDILGKIWEKFTEDRITWLMNFDETNSFPFFLNSQVWMLVDMLTRGNKAI